jgi:ribosomal-protein-alanine N-acetyltransferase
MLYFRYLFSNKIRHAVTEMTAENAHQDLTFEPMHLDDLQRVLKIEHQCFEDPWSKTYFAMSLKRPRSYEHFYVARRKDTVVGYIVFNIFHEEAHILNIAVPPANQRQGIGKYLLASALEMILAADGHEVFLEVAVSNLPAQHLYRQFGFRICGIRKNYYGRYKDAYVFRKGVEIHVV